MLFSAGLALVSLGLAGVGVEAQGNLNQLVQATRNETLNESLCTVSSLLLSRDSTQSSPRTLQRLTCISSLEDLPSDPTQTTNQPDRPLVQPCRQFGFFSLKRWSDRRRRHRRSRLPPPFPSRAPPLPPPTKKIQGTTVRTSHERSLPSHLRRRTQNSRRPQPLLNSNPQPLPPRGPITLRNLLSSLSSSTLPSPLSLPSSRIQPLALDLSNPCRSTRVARDPLVVWRSRRKFGCWKV